MPVRDAHVLHAPVPTTTNGRRTEVMKEARSLRRGFHVPLQDRALHIPGTALGYFIPVAFGGSSGDIPLDTRVYVCPPRLRGGE